MFNYECPIAKHLEDLPNEECAVHRGQLQKVIIQRLFSTSGVKNEIPLEEIKAKTGMTKYFSAADGTKMAITPFFENPEMEPGGPVTFGGGNQTRNGIPIVIDGEPTTVKGVFNRISVKAAAVLKKYMGENIGVYLIFEGGGISCLTDNIESPSKVRPIPIQSFFVRDLKTGDRENLDNYQAEWSFPYGWSDNLIDIKRSDLDYDPLAELVNVTSGVGA